ncbi:AAA family ATPase [Listeria monocytogenes]|nr:AAA family ATPase [Listeria monocytogenes]
MNAIDIYQLTRVKDFESFIFFAKRLSNVHESINIREHEKESLISLVEIFEKNELNSKSYSGFYFSYSIPQIGTEFDLLRINDDLIINIELKSAVVPLEQIKKQLIKNKTYLAHLSKETLLFTYIMENNKFYQLDNTNEIKEIQVNELINYIENQNNCILDEINTLFKVSEYLVSPLNTTEKFLNNEYFLTHQQKENKNKIIKIFEMSSSATFLGLTGKAGTGKTLTLYDIAFECSEKGSVCIIHCGILSEGHDLLNSSYDKVDIFAAKKMSSIDFSKYSYIFVDESQRFFEAQFESLIKEIQQYEIQSLFSYDFNQSLSYREVKTNIPRKLNTIDGYQKFDLSNKIRTNPELSSFIKKIFNIKAPGKYCSYASVSLSYANNENEVKILLDKYKNEGYIFINYTASNFKYVFFDNFPSTFNTHRVIGQEFDKVVMIIDSSFLYNSKGNLMSKKHPNPDYLFNKLLYQGLTRVREKLGIIIVNNPNVFSTILEIVKHPNDKKMFD